MIESVNLNWNTKVITVTLEDASTKEYTDADSYITDFPERVADAVAMGWEVPIVETPIEEVVVEEAPAE